MLSKKKNTGCCSDPKCCGSAVQDSTHAGTSEKRQIKIDFLYLNLEVCTRCQGADTTLGEAIGDVAQVLESAGVEVLVNKVNINTEDLAVRYRFVSSPTIRINGRDIALNVKESMCESCGDLCGETVDCRIWTWQGVDYPQPPKAMIIDAILRAVYGAPATEDQHENKPYQLPDNLKHFYQAMQKKGN